MSRGDLNDELDRLQGEARDLLRKLSKNYERQRVIFNVIHPHFIPTVQALTNGGSAPHDPRGDESLAAPGDEP